jgi:hypothetical protein
VTVVELIVWVELTVVAVVWLELDEAVDDVVVVTRAEVLVADVEVTELV